VVRLEAGLRLLEVAAPAAGQRGPLALWLGQPPGTDDQVDILADSGSGDQWLSGGRRAVVRAPRAGALLLATTFGPSDEQVVAPDVALRAVGDASSSIVTAPAAPPSTLPGTLVRPQSEVRAEITVHLEGVGDRVFAGSSWAGRPGEQKRIEGFSIRPLQELRPNEIEYKALHPGGVETPWIAGPQFCGTRGRSLPIIGLAIRIAPHVQDQFSVVYQAAFFRSGIGEPRSNGTPCLPKFAGDVLEAVNIRILQSQPG
jgi:hypothetical protein